MEALDRGLPVVTIKYGDICDIIGEENCVENYDELYQQTNYLCRDGKLRVQVNKTQTVKASRFFDNEYQMAGILEEAQRRHAFYDDKIGVINQCCGN